MNKSGYVYILHSKKNNSYYVGSTSDLTRRLNEHQQGHSPYTSHLLPLLLVFSKQFPDFKTARKVELWLKNIHSRKIIEQIVKTNTIKKQFQ